MTFWRMMSGYPCHVCGGDCSGAHGLPMWCGEVLPNDWAGEWGGFTVCKPCFDVNTFDTGEPRAPRLPDDSLVGRPT